MSPYCDECWHFLVEVRPDVLVCENCAYREAERRSLENQQIIDVESET